MNTQSSLSQPKPEQVSPNLCIADGFRYRPPSDSTKLNRQKDYRQKTLVASSFLGRDELGALIEIVRDSKNAKKLLFLRWKSGSAALSPFIERDGQVFELPSTSSIVPQLSLPSEFVSCGEPAELFAEISCTISKFVKLRPDDLRIVVSFVLASWFPDCFEAVPYLWVLGPLGSGKTKLLKLLWCFCLRGLLAGDLPSGSLYKLTDTWNPTLIIDEFEPGRSASRAEILRMIRAGSVAGVPTFRNGQPFSTYGLKIIASRQPIDDVALASRGVIVSLLPSEDDLLPLDEDTRQDIAKAFQNKLLAFRLANYEAVQDYYRQLNTPAELSPRLKQIARALIAPFQGNANELLAILGKHDQDARMERFLEPEWLAAEALYRLCHQDLGERATAGARWRSDSQHQRNVETAR